MMYRSGRGMKPNQEITLAVHLRRAAFDAVLGEAVHSAHVPRVYESEAAWKAQAARSQVRLQWDPDHGPSGAKLERRAIQLGLRGNFLRRYGREWIVALEDISPSSTNSAPTSAPAASTNSPRPPRTSTP